MAPLNFDSEDKVVYEYVSKKDSGNEGDTLIATLIDDFFLPNQRIEEVGYWIEAIKTPKLKNVLLSIKNLN